MDSKTQKHLQNLRSEDRTLQNEAFSSILKQTEKPVDWAYEEWDQLVEGLRHRDNPCGQSRRRSLPTLRKVTR